MERRKNVTQSEAAREEAAREETEPSQLQVRKRKRAESVSEEPEPSQAEVRKNTRATRKSQRIASIAKKAGTAPRALPKPPVGPTPKADKVPGSMIMEYLSRGSLDNWLEKLGKSLAASNEDPKLAIPNMALWDMMACCKLPPQPHVHVHHMLTAAI